MSLGRRSEGEELAASKVLDATCQESLLVKEVVQ